MQDNGGLTKAIKEQLHMEQKGMGQYLVYCLLGYIPTPSCKHVVTGLDPRPS